MAKAQQNDKAARTRKKERKNTSAGVAHVNSTFNNTIVTISDAQGNTISVVCRPPRLQRLPQSHALRGAVVTAEDAGKKAKEHGMKTLEVLVKGPGSGRESAPRALQSVGFAFRPSRTSRRFRTTAAVRVNVAGYKIPHRAGAPFSRGRAPVLSMALAFDGLITTDFLFHTFRQKEAYLDTEKLARAD